MNDNKLIAEFMGVHDEISLDSIAGNIHSWRDAPFFYITEDSKEKVMEGIAEYSKYHTSWDWLMPVLIKIERIIVGEVTWISTYCDIEREYKRAVEWIKKYNDNPKYMTLHDAEKENTKRIR